MASQSRAEVIVVGLGNPIRSDDGIGVILAREIGKRTERERVDIEECPRGGLDLLELIAGHSCAHIIDAIITGKADPGHLWQLDINDLPPSLTLASSHEVDLPTALRLGKELGYVIPDKITVWAVEVLDPHTISESLGTAVAGAVQSCAATILQNLD